MPITRTGSASCVWQGKHPSPRLRKAAILSLWAALTVLFAGSCSRAESVLCPSGSEPDAGTQVNLGAVEDCEILLSIRDNLAGNASLNWSTQIPIDEWEGVEIDASALPVRVTELSLIEKGLTGTIPADMGSLSHLEILDLTHNDLTGEMPAELGSLDNLRELHLPYNRLTGVIPAELGNLSNLRFLILAWNDLGGEIPPALGELSSLEILDLK